MKKKVSTYILTLLILAMSVSSCSHQTTPSLPIQTIETIKKDHQIVQFDPLGAKIIELDLAKAAKIAVQHNQDIRTSALEVLAAQDSLDLERFSALPQLNLNATAQGRSNNGASSSRSALTGQQSLEPSISSDRYQKTIDFDLRWNMIDLVLAVYNTKIASKSTQIAAIRHQKITNDILRDIHAAYWRAWIYQEQQPKLEQLIKQAQEHLSKINTARNNNILSIDEAADNQSVLLQDIQNGRDILEQIAFSKSELKGLLSIPETVKISLRKPLINSQPVITALLKENSMALEQEAIQARPEIQEALLQVDIAKNQLRQEIIKSIPGAEIFVGLNRDSNSFLDDDRWSNFSLSAVSNIISLFTLPKRYDTAKNNKILEEQKLLALSTAVITQVHIARARLDLLNDNASLSSQEAQQIRSIAYSTSEKRKAGFVSGQDNLTAQLRASISQIRSYIAQAEAQDASLALLNTLGRSPATLLLKEKSS